MSKDIGSEAASFQADVFVRCVADVKRLFTETGDITPAGGVCYINKTHDMCATVYDHGRKARVFFGRKREFIGREQWPCFYKNEIKLYG